ncbi:MAG TPA: DUF4345 family protein [Pseudomonadales bacterium]
MMLIARILAGLVGLFFVVWGLRFYFAPEALAAEFAITPLGVAGLSTIRGDLGGAFVAIGGLIAFGLQSNAPRWLYTAALILGAVALGRAIGFVADGTVPSTVVPFVVELVFIAVLLAAARLIGRQPA